MSNNASDGSGKLRTISVRKIKEPPCEDRFDLELTKEEFEHIKDIPLVVLYSRESTAYLIVEGRRRFKRAKKIGFKKLRCFVLRSADNDDEALMLRLKYVLDFQQPLHVLEVTRLVYQIRENEVLKYGPGFFYKWGGKRKNMKSFIKVLEEHFPHKSYYLRAVDLLGRHLGLLAIEGLYDYLTGKEEPLTIYRIHRMNTILRAIGLRQKIENRIGDMAAEDEDIDDIREEVGRMAYDALFSDPDEYNLPRRKRRKRKSGSGEQSENSDENKESPVKVFGSKPGPIGSKEFSTVKALAFAFEREVANLVACFQGKTKLTATESEKISVCWSSIQGSSTLFWKAFMRASKN